MPEVPKIVRERLKPTESPQSHPDPDLLTAFAEKSLPDRERNTVLQHLARCSDCRDVIALALPTTETPTMPLPHRHVSWLTWPAVRWGLAAAGVIVVASLGIVQYQNRSSRASLAKVSVQLEAPRAEAKAEVPAPLTTNDKERGFASNAATPTANSPAALPKLVAPEAGKRDQPVRRDSSQVAGFVGGAAPSAGPRSTFQQQVAGQRSAPAQSQLFDKLQTSRVVAPSQTLEAHAAAPQIGAGEGGGMAAGIAAGAQSKQLDYSKAKEPLPPVPASPAPNNPQDEGALFRNGLKALPGQMGGYVVDPTGAAVGNAQITLKPSSGAAATTVTDPQGHWLIAGLPSGNYQVRAEAPGFKTTSRSFAYDATRPSMFVFPLNIGTVSETVEVAAQSTTIQAETTAVANTVTGAQLSQLPINGRDVTTLAALVRWTISPTGGLQRSLDQGKTWQDVNVLARAAPFSNFTSVDATAETVVMTAPAKAPANEKDSRKKSPKRETAAPLTFRAVTANGLEVWAGGSSSALFHSSDGGTHWTRILPLSGGVILTGDVIGLEFTDPQHGTVTTSTSEIWTTADSGQTWQKH